MDIQYQHNAFHFKKYLNSVPRGLGFLLMRYMLVSPPVLVVFLQKSDMDPSSIFQSEVATVLLFFLL